MIFFFSNQKAIIILFYCFRCYYSTVLILALKTFDTMTFKTICVKSAYRLCSKQRKGFGLKPSNSVAYASLSTQPALFSSGFGSCAFVIFRERGYAPIVNQVIVFSQLAKVPNNFVHLAMDRIFGDRGYVRSKKIIVLR